MRKFQIFAVLLASAILTSCSETDANTTENNTNTEVTESNTTSTTKKWKVTPDMMEYILLMETEVNNFGSIENPSNEDYQELALFIDKNIRLLTTNCTMEGPAHDELHNWLVPFIELSEEFDVAETIDNQQKVYEEFKKIFVKFHATFE